MPRGVAVTQKRKEQSVYQASALSGIYERDAYEWDAISGSDRLRCATTLAIMRFAEDHRVSESEASAILLGTRGSSAPRAHFSTADHTGHRPSEIVARPIGEIIKPIVERVLNG